MDYVNPLDILKSNDIVYEDVEIPEWDGKVCIRSLTAEERDLFEASSIVEVKTMQRGRAKTKHKANMKNYRARLVVMAACKGMDDPTHLFTPDQVNELGRKSASALDRLFEVAQRLARITQEDIEDYEKN